MRINKEIVGKNCLPILANLTKHKNQFMSISNKNSNFSDRFSLQNHKQIRLFQLGLYYLSMSMWCPT